MTYKDKAEQYVREKLPELMELSFGCDIKVNLTQGGGEIATVVGKTPHQVHWSWAKHHLNKSSFTGSEMDGRYKIIGHPIQLQHWLDAMNDVDYVIDSYGKVWKRHGDCVMTFNMKSGQPATEADYKALCEIVGLDTNNDV